MTLTIGSMSGVLYSGGLDRLAKVWSPWDLTEQYWLKHGAGVTGVMAMTRKGWPETVVTSVMDNQVREWRGTDLLHTFAPKGGLYMIGVGKINLFELPLTDNLASYYTVTINYKVRLYDLYYHPNSPFATLEQPATRHVGDALITCATNGGCAGSDRLIVGNALGNVLVWTHCMAQPDVLKVTGLVRAVARLAGEDLVHHSQRAQQRGRPDRRGVSICKFKSNTESVTGEPNRHSAIAATLVRRLGGPANSLTWAWPRSQALVKLGAPPIHSGLLSLSTLPVQYRPNNQVLMPPCKKAPPKKKLCRSPRKEIK